MLLVFFPEYFDDDLTYNCNNNVHPPDGALPYEQSHNPLFYICHLQSAETYYSPLNLSQKYLLQKNS